MSFQQWIIDPSAGTALDVVEALVVPFMGMPMERTIGVPPVGIPVGGALGIPVRGRCGGPIYICSYVRCHLPSTTRTLAPPSITVERGARGLPDWPTLIKQMVPPPTFANYSLGATMYRRYGTFTNANFAGLQMLSSMVASPSTSKTRRSGSSQAAAAR